MIDRKTDLNNGRPRSKGRGVFVKAHEQKRSLKPNSNDFVEIETNVDLVDIQDADFEDKFSKNKPIKRVLTVQEKLAQEFPSLPPQAEVYMNLLDGDEFVDDPFEPDPQVVAPEPKATFDVTTIVRQEQVYSSSDAETESTVHSRHMTPSATPKSSFSQHDRPNRPKVHLTNRKNSMREFHREKMMVSKSNSFDLAKLLDPFEQLEREFNWRKETDQSPIKPPSEFGSFVPDSMNDSGVQEELCNNIDIYDVIPTYEGNNDSLR